MGFNILKSTHARTHTQTHTNHTYTQTRVVKKTKSYTRLTTFVRVRQLDASTGACTAFGFPVLFYLETNKKVLLNPPSNSRHSVVSIFRYYRSHFLCVLLLHLSPLSCPMSHACCLSTLALLNLIPLWRQKKAVHCLWTVMPCYPFTRHTSAIWSLLQRNGTIEKDP